MPNTTFLTTSDVSAALVGAGFSTVYGISTPPMQALQAMVISIIARLFPDSSMITNNITSMNEGQKNQLIVAVLSGIMGYYKNPKGSMFKAVVTGVSQDLIGQEILKTFNFEEKSLLGGGGTA
jgi:hypothetical protein